MKKASNEGAKKTQTNAKRSPFLRWGGVHFQHESFKRGGFGLCCRRFDLFNRNVFLSDNHIVIPYKRSMKWLVLIVNTFCIATLAFNTTAIMNALPSMQHDLTLSPSIARWIINSYILCAAAFMVLGGRLGDLFGHFKAFFTGRFSLHWRHFLSSSRQTGILS